jgi:hypothetical protein
MRRLVGITGAVALAAALVASVSAATYLPNKWRANPPFTVTMVNVSVTRPELVIGLQQAAAAWSASSVLDVVIGGKGNNKVQAYEVNLPSQQLIGWADIQGVAGKGYIKTAAVTFNDAYIGTIFTQDYYTGIVCHEIGHALGLDHVETPDPESTCMTPGPSGPNPSAQDFINLAALYGG